LPPPVCRRPLDLPDTISRSPDDGKTLSQVALQPQFIHQAGVELLGAELLVFMGPVGSLELFDGVVQLWWNVLAFQGAAEGVIRTRGQRHADLVYGCPGVVGDVG